MSRHTGSHRSVRTAAFLAAFSALGVLAFVLGCPASAGVTVGGQQDIAAARLEVQAGGIPDPASITVQGFMSEHAIPVDPPENAPLLFATAGVAWNADFDTFAPTTTVQIGFGTTIDREAFEREPLNLVLVVDRSGSMAHEIDHRSSTTKIEAVKIAIDRLLAQLTAADRVSIVAFNDESSVRVEAAVGTDLARIKTELDEITAKGGTQLAAGLRRGFQVAARNHSDDRSDRVLIFTDAQLRDRAEQAARSFLSALREYAEQGIGATVLGVGFDFGHDIAFDISQVRGASYFFLGSYDRIVSVLDDEFKFLVTPVAYDLVLKVSVPFGFDVAYVYGIEAEDPYSHELELSVPTLFLSSREGGGAVFLRTLGSASLDRSAANTVARIDLTYGTPGGDSVSMNPLMPKLPPEPEENQDAPYFESDAVRRGVLLLNTANALHDACEDVWGGFYYDYSGFPRAIARLTDFLDYFDGMADGLEDCIAENSRCLSQERALVVKLLENMGQYYY